MQATPTPPEATASVSPPAAVRPRGRWKLLLVLAICAAPLLASYFTYYVIKPGGRTNYGALLDPRAHPMPALAAVTLDGAPASLDAWKGRWLMLVVDSGHCAQACQDKLFAIRQLRLMQGKEMDRIERVWLVSDPARPDAALLRLYGGMQVLRAAPDAIHNWLPVEAGGAVEQHIYLVDPLGNLMMRFPKNADPARIKKDLAKLLYASAIG